MDTDPGMELEALEDERRDADRLQAQYERESNAFVANQLHMATLRKEGKLDKAAATCQHSGGYPLDSPAAGFADDPSEGEEGYRCVDCGSRLDRAPWDGGKVTIACEFPGEDPLWS